MAASRWTNSGPTVGCLQIDFDVGTVQQSRGRVVLVRWSGTDDCFVCVDCAQLCLVEIRSHIGWNRPCCSLSSETVIADAVTLPFDQQPFYTEKIVHLPESYQVSESKRRIAEHTTVFRKEDIIPVPCHPDSLAMAYALKRNGSTTALSGMVDPKVLIEGGRNTIVFESDEAVRQALFKTYATNHSPGSWSASLRELLCCLPGIAAPSALSYENVFRVLINHFIDAHSFETRSIKKTCVHIAQPDGRMIPFDTFNLFYREESQRMRLNSLRDLVQIGHTC